MKTENAYSSKELSPTTWPDFEALFAKHNGAWGGCWCMFYHTKGEFLNNRRRGVAGFGLNAALASIKKKGGGIVEAYPSTKPSKGARLMWSGTVSMFEEAGFDVASQLGKSSVVIRKIV